MFLRENSICKRKAHYHNISCHPEVQLLALKDENPESSFHFLSLLFFPPSTLCWIFWLFKLLSFGLSLSKETSNQKYFVSSYLQPLLLLLFRSSDATRGKALFPSLFILLLQNCSDDCITNSWFILTKFSSIWHHSLKFSVCLKSILSPFLWSKMMVK